MAQESQAYYPSPNLTCRYIVAPVDQVLNHDHTVAVIQFNGCCGVSSDPRVIQTGCKPLSHPAPLEVWTSPLPIERGQRDALGWSKTPDFIIAHYWLEHDNEVPLDALTCGAYREILALLRHEGYPHIQRMWNYITNINEGEGDQERYKLFCSGRHRAFIEAEIAQQEFPAACAIGQHARHNMIYLVASRQAGRHFENPRQVSAYHYPRQYGRKSPSFARATLSAFDPDHLFLSGTASVIGHETLYAENPIKQLDETLLNIDTLMEHVAATLNVGKVPHPELLKVYLRNEALYDFVSQQLTQRFGQLPILYLQGDICRANLALEIDGIFRFQ